MTSDYLAELLIAGILADNGWDIYFPHRDKGFDFVISKNINGVEIIRPVQVKGKYPENKDIREPSYGYTGRLSKMHKDMVLAIVYTHNSVISSSSLIAYMPYSKILSSPKGHKCLPGVRNKAEISIKQGYEDYFNGKGLDLIESKNFS